MSEEIKAAQEASEAEETQQELPATDEQPTEGAKAPDEESQQLKALLEKEREAKEKAEKAAADLAFKNREKKRKEETFDEEEETERPLTSKDLERILEKEREATRRELMSARISEIADQFSSTPVERELILTIHKNRSFPENLSLEEQIQECYLIANKRKILGENSELKRALSNKARVTKDASSTYHDAPASNQPRLEQGEAAEMARVGFSWNGTSRLYEKKLPNGQTLVKDPKTKATWIKG